MGGWKDGFDGRMGLMGGGEDGFDGRMLLPLWRMGLMGEGC